MGTEVFFPEKGYGITYYLKAIMTIGFQWDLFTIPYFGLIFQTVLLLSLHFPAGCRPAPGAVASAAGGGVL
jgi:hypothetical protein